MEMAFLLVILRTSCNKRTYNCAYYQSRVESVSGTLFYFQLVIRFVVYFSNVGRWTVAAGPDGLEISPSIDRGEKTPRRRANRYTTIVHAHMYCLLMLAPRCLLYDCGTVFLLFVIKY